MLLIIIWYFFIIIFGLGLGLRPPEIGLGLGLVALASASASRFWPCLTSLMLFSISNNRYNYMLVCCEAVRSAILARAWLLV